MSVEGVVPIVTTLLLASGAAMALVGWRLLTGSKGLQFHNLQRDRLRRGWRWLGAGAVLLALGVGSGAFGGRVGHSLYPPTPTATSSPTITLTPTVTLTPTITLTPRETSTPTATPRPTLPEPIGVLVRETLTPPPGALFSPIVVASRLDEFNRPQDGVSVWTNAPARLLGAFSYDQLRDGVRWTALWLREGAVVCAETKLWEWGTGGTGYTECEPPGGWTPGQYVIQMFLGDQWWVSSAFEIAQPATATPTLAPLASPTP